MLVDMFRFLLQGHLDGEGSLVRFRSPSKPGGPGGMEPTVADEKNPLTGAQLLAQQAAREAAAQKAAAEAQAAARKAREAQQEEALRVAVGALKASWHASAVAAAERNGVRFVVIAEVIGSVPAVDEVIGAVRAGGFEATYSNIQTVGGPQGRGRARAVSPLATIPEGEVTDGNIKGWKPANVPQFMAPGGGGHRWLTVRWG